MEKCPHNPKVGGSSPPPATNCVNPEFIRVHIFFAQNFGMKKIPKIMVFWAKNPKFLQVITKVITKFAKFRQFGLISFSIV